MTRSSKKNKQEAVTVSPPSKVNIVDVIVAKSNTDSKFTTPSGESNKQEAVSISPPAKVNIVDAIVAKSNTDGKKAAFTTRSGKSNKKEAVSISPPGKVNIVAKSNTDGKKPAFTPVRIKIEPGMGIRKRKKAPDSGTSYSDALFTESLGTIGEFIALIGIKKNGNGAFFQPLVKPVPPSLTNEDTVDIRISEYLFLRQSRDDNKRVPTDSRGQYFRIGIVACPDKEKHFDVQKGLVRQDYLVVEKMVRDSCAKELQTYNEKNYKTRKIQFEQTRRGNIPTRTVYDSWNPNHHSKTSKELKFRPLDHVFIDEAIGYIMEYYACNSPDRKEWYKELCSAQSCFSPLTFFSRGKDNKFSDYAVTEFGYPCGNEIDDNGKNGNDGYN